MNIVYVWGSSRATFFGEHHRVEELISALAAIVQKGRGRNLMEALRVSQTKQPNRGAL